MRGRGSNFPVGSIVISDGIRQEEVSGWHGCGGMKAWLYRWKSIGKRFARRLRTQTVPQLDPFTRTRFAHSASRTIVASYPIENQAFDSIERSSSSPPRVKAAILSQSEAAESMGDMTRGQERDVFFISRPKEDWSSRQYSAEIVVVLTFPKFPLIIYLLNCHNIVIMKSRYIVTVSSLF